MYHGSPQPYTAPRGEYGEYYKNSQFGHGAQLPAYGGVARQKGHGIGSLIGGLLRSAVPLLGRLGKSVAKSAGRALLSTGKNVLTDVLQGKSLKTSVVNRAKSAGKQALKRAASSAAGYLSGPSSPPPAKRRATTKGTGRKQKRKKKKQQAGRGRSTSKGKPKKRKKSAHQRKSVTLF